MVCISSYGRSSNNSLPFVSVIKITFYPNSFKQANDKAESANVISYCPKSAHQENLS
jgi:hypothetical protein